MRKLILLAVLAMASGSVLAAGSACDSKAAEKKLAGAAKNSFIKKCEKDSQSAAQAMCDNKAKDKKLAGAAKNSFVKKCVTDSSKA